MLIDFTIIISVCYTAVNFNEVVVSQTRHHIILWFTINHKTFFRLSLVSDINMSQGSVATRMRSAEVCNNSFTPCLKKRFTFDLL